jgi:hypothetical protein
VALPESKVLGIALGTRGISAASKILDTLVGEFSIAWPAGNVEIDITGPVFCGIGVTGSNQLTNELDHGGDVPGCPRLTGGREDVQRTGGVVEFSFYSLGKRPPGFTCFR